MARLNESRSLSSLFINDPAVLELTLEEADELVVARGFDLGQARRFGGDINAPSPFRQERTQPRRDGFTQRAVGRRGRENGFEMVELGQDGGRHRWLLGKEL